MATDVQIFTAASSSWTKPSNAQETRAIAVGSGGSGTTIQVFKIISANPIKNGGVVVLGPKKGAIQSMDDEAANTPAIVDIEEKYSDRFDDERYYDGDDDE